MRQIRRTMLHSHPSPLYFWSSHSAHLSLISTLPSASCATYPTNRLQQVRHLSLFPLSSCSSPREDSKSTVKSSFGAEMAENGTNYG
jgi:hypothetical protein